MTPAEHNETQQPTLKAFLDNELSWGRQIAVRLHLARCASCREELRAMQQIGKELRGQTTIDPLDPGLRARILATVQEMKPEPTAPVRSRRPTLIWGGAAFAALLLVAVFVSSPMFAPVSQSLFAPAAKSRSSSGMRNAEVSAATSSPVPAAPGSPSSNNAPQEMYKSAGKSPKLAAPGLEMKQAAPEIQSDGSVAAQTAPKMPELRGDNRVARADSSYSSAPQAQDSLNPPLPQGRGVADNGSIDAKKAVNSPVAGSRAQAPQSVAGNMLSPISKGRGGETRGGFSSHKQERAIDKVAMDRVGSSQQAVVLERAGFDLDGFQFVTQGGQRIAVPFHKSLNTLRFTRSIDGKMVLDRAVQPPVLYLSPADSLINDAVPGARWQPLPPSYNSTMQLYVRPAPDWEQFTAMRWYPNMTAVGGLFSIDAPDGAYTWLSGSHIQIGATFYPDFAAYRAFADAHPDSQRLRAVYSNADASLPTGSPAVPAKSAPPPGVPPGNTPKSDGRAGKKPTP